jgi:hypothetical protein
MKYKYKNNVFNKCLFDERPDETSYTWESTADENSGTWIIVSKSATDERPDETSYTWESTADENSGTWIIVSKSATDERPDETSYTWESTADEELNRSNCIKCDFQETCSGNYIQNLTKSINDEEDTKLDKIRKFDISTKEYLKVKKRKKAIPYEFKD